MDVKSQKKMPDYSKSKIYVIRAPDTDKVYVGSTIKSLSARMANHRAHYKQYTEGKSHYTTAWDLVSLPGSYIELIEEFACENIEQLRKREGEIIRSTPNCVNKRIEARTKKEYNNDRKEQRKEYDESHKEQRKEYLDANREHINKLRRERWAANRELMRSKQQEYRAKKASSSESEGRN